MSVTIHQQPIEWVDSQEYLHELCEQWMFNKMLAIDTEFMRSQTYYPIAGLIQVNDGQKNYLIDPTVIDCAAFGAVLKNEHVVKVLHSCSEDLEVFLRLLNVIPINILDTQIAAALCGYGFSVGYGNLVKVVLDIDLPKAETRSDWLQRPLSLAQKEYAAIDVEFLYQLASLLVVTLKQQQRFSWVTEDCDRVLQNFADNQSIDNSFKRIRQAWRLNPKQLAVLKALASWREREAQRRDVPRNRVIKEHSLLELAMKPPKNAGQLRKFEGITERMIRADGEAIVALISEIESADPKSYPDVLARPLSGSENRWAKKLREVVQGIAETQDLAVETLLKKREYEAITRHFMTLQDKDAASIREDLNGFISGWRATLLNETLVEVISADNETHN